MHVYVFALEIEQKFATCNFSLNFRQCSHNLLAFVVCQHTNSSKHACMGNGTLNVLLEKPMIKGDRFGKLFNTAVGLGIKPTIPRALLATCGLLDSKAFDA